MRRVDEPESGIPPWAWGLLVLAAAYAAAQWFDAHPPPSPPPVRFDSFLSTRRLIPRFNPVEPLAVASHIERDGDARHVRLETGVGRAELVLHPLPRPPAASRRMRLPLGAGVRAELVPKDATEEDALPSQARVELRGGSVAQGRVFVAAVARWLQTDVPEQVDPPGELVPVVGLYEETRTAGGGTTLLLSFDTNLIAVEWEVEMSADGTTVSIRDPGWSDQDALLALLAKALRDGRPPRRSRRRDARMSSDTPHVSEVRELAEARGLDEHTWLGAGLVAAVGREPARIRRWASLGAEPSDLGEVPGVVRGLVPAPRGPLVCVLSIRARAGGHVVLPSPAGVAVVSSDGAPVRTVAASDASLWVDSIAAPAWSPDGRRIAVEFASPPGSRPFTRIVRLIDVSSAATVAETKPEWSLGSPRWTEEGLVLTRVDNDAVTPWLWDYASGKVAPLARTPTDEESWTRPAGGSWGAHPMGPPAYEVEVDIFGLRVRGEGRDREFLPTRPDEARALGDIKGRGPSWLGPRRIVLRLDDPLVLDLDTLMLRYLFPVDAGCAFYDVGPDGRLVLGRDGSGRILWGRHETP